MGGVSLTGQYSEGQMCIQNHRKVYQRRLVLLTQEEIPGNSQPTNIWNVAKKKEAF